MAQSCLTCRCETSIFNPPPFYEFPISVDRTESRRVMSATAIPFIQTNRLTFDIMFGDDIALHFDIRLGYYNERTVVINTRRNGVWGEEQRPAAFPFKNDEFFLLEIDAGDEGFGITAMNASQKMNSARLINYECLVAFDLHR